MTGINRSTKPIDVVETTQKAMLNALGDFTEEGQKQFKDPGDIDTLIKLSRALNDTATTTRKLDIEDRAIDEASQIARDMIEIQRSAPAMVRGRDIKDVDGEVVKNGPPKLDRTRVPKVELIPGQLGSGVKDINLDEFMQKDRAED